MCCDILYIMPSAKDVNIPRELLWDYKEPPDDLLWRLQRIADFFPAYGTDERTVRLLHDHRDSLRLDPGKRRLIELYYEVRREKAAPRD